MIHYVFGTGPEPRIVPLITGPDQDPTLFSVAFKTLIESYLLLVQSHQSL
jgi:hypothetical protein